MTTTRSRRWAAGFAAAVLPLLTVACSSSSSDAGDGASDGSGAADATTPASSVAAPKATIPADIPENILEAYKPMDVTGEQLPKYDPSVSPDPAVGMTAPVFVGYDLDGNVRKIDATTQGKTMIVNLAHWCVHCNAEVPIINQMRESGALPKDLNVVAILTGSRPDYPNWPPGKWIEDMEWKYPAIFDGIGNVDIDGKMTESPLAMPYLGGEGYPFIVFVDENGKVAGRSSGEKPYEKLTTEVLDTLYKQ